LEFEAQLWDERLKAVPLREIDVLYAQGMIAYASKQAALFRDIAARAIATATAPSVPRGKKRPRAPIVDPLMDLGNVGLDLGEEDDEEGLDDDDGDGEEIRGIVESDEELVMGGEIDNE
jgi:hypothetical protein